MKGSCELLMCAVLLYCRMLRPIHRDRAVRQKARGPRCMVIAAERMEAAAKCTPGEYKMKPPKKVKGEAVEGLG